MKRHDVINLIWGDLEANWHHGRWPRAIISTIGHIFWKKKRTFWGISTDQGLLVNWDEASLYLLNLLAILLEYSV